ncbi:hypothetical protein LCGC14_3153780 [marine sediment metagenome]|uniref:Lipoprotein SmpA/OmlA domain-containing protein n=1 Tax=marine sediment metagenome TaxID=412755 RepID=A0A0F8WHC9_9ZZZZ
MVWAYAMSRISVFIVVFLLLGCTNVFDQPRRLDYIQAHPELSDQLKEDIYGGIIRRGMTTEEVIASWSRPRDINRSVGSWGVHQQWIYGDIGYRKYLYFENGKLTGWQD